jgi:hypothetical protein
VRDQWAGLGAKGSAARPAGTIEETVLAAFIQGLRQRIVPVRNWLVAERIGLQPRNRSASRLRRGEDSPGFALPPQPARLAVQN